MIDVLHPEHLNLATSLPDAACVNRIELFDATAGGPGRGRGETAYARRAALALCRQCPALKLCRQWFDHLPDWERPLGVVAGRVITHSTLAH